MCCDRPLEAHEALPVRQHRTVTEKQPTDTIENEEVSDIVILIEIQSS